VTAIAAPIPFLDLTAVNEAFRADFDSVWEQVLKHGGYIGGPELDRFEQDFAAYCGASSCVGVANGTDALELILRGLGIGPGDEVIVPANTFIATAEAVRAVHARLSFVDVDPETLLIDPAAAEAAVTPATAAIIGVHLYGQMFDVHRIGELAARHGLALIEDAAQAHGASFAGARAGSVGHAAAFSFYPGKNLGAVGDGGAVITGDAALAQRIRSIANHGRSASDRYRHEELGRNSRLDTLQAGVLAAKLPLLDQANADRSAAMEAYRGMLPSTCLPVGIHPLATPVYHLAVIQVADRPRIAEALTEAGIGWGIHYPIPCHHQPAFADDAIATHAPVAEHAAGRIISLPMSPTLRHDQVARVCDVLRGVSA
jgi:dTDP-4-amino-4,6-dideoxygalactose transaminase